MTPYEYLTVFISVVLGLAVVHLLSGVALLLDTRVRARYDWIHGVWTANVFITTMLVWWFNFHLNEVVTWTLPFFLNLVAYSVVLYLMSGLLFPVRGAEVTDFKVHFEANRPRFFLVCFLFQVVDLSDILLERQALATAWAPIQLILLALFTLGFLVGIRTGNRTYHGLLAIAWLVTCLSWAVAGLDDPIVSL